MISGATRLVGLIGLPVAGSLSPAMQNAAFAARGLDWAYVPLPVERGRLAEAIGGLGALGFAGVNVTAPYKLEAAALCDTELESVNTLVVEGDRLRGFSTDAEILRSVEAKRPAILGDGGAARAFAAALPGARIFARGKEWPPETADADVIVNATPARDGVLAQLRRGQTLVELPYPETETARAARAAGAEVISGLEVLAAQGAASFELWTGVPAPVAVMRRAVGLPP